MQQLLHPTDTAELSGVGVGADRYTPRVERWRKVLADRWTETGMTLDQIAAKSKLNRGTVHRILDGTTAEPGFESVAQIAFALGVPLSALDPHQSHARPGGAGHDAAGAVEGVGSTAWVADLLVGLAKRGDAEFPAPDSWQGDIHQAIAALNRALRRPTAPADTDKASGDA